jgi:hypothetical protein
MKSFDFGILQIFTPRLSPYPAGKRISRNEGRVNQFYMLLSMPCKNFRFSAMHKFPVL